LPPTWKAGWSQVERVRVEEGHARIARVVLVDARFVDTVMPIASILKWSLTMPFGSPVVPDV
jgi:hypothetical protein